MNVRTLIIWPRLEYSVAIGISTRKPEKLDDLDHFFSGLTISENLRVTFGIFAAAAEVGALVCMIVNARPAYLEIFGPLQLIWPQYNGITIRFRHRSMRCRQKWRRAREPGN